MASYYETVGGQQRLIPGAGTYLADQNKAQSAYDRAMSQLKATRAKRQITSGLGDDWNVDPNAQYGGYQALLQGQGLQLMQAEEAAQQRGFFGAGLGNQAQNALRYGHAAEMLGFKNQLSDWENEYQMGMNDALRAKNDEMLASLMGAAGDAYSEGDFSQYNPEQPGPPTITSDKADLVPPTKAPVSRSYFAPTATTKKQRAKQTRAVLNNRLRAGRM